MLVCTYMCLYMHLCKHVCVFVCADECVWGGEGGGHMPKLGLWPILGTACCGYTGLTLDTHIAYTDSHSYTGENKLMGTDHVNV